jgi:rhamnose utilization protein RhaD (predicted bifunctional aldolase and dehydrogenase)/NAD(P)-dependent dehydrogenase (short-subunit alcohol dehydrogenase family)
MKNRYSENQSKIIINRARRNKRSIDVALCVYISNLLGSESSLVLHGGGNTSVKSFDDTLYIKGSGFDLGTIKPSGFTALYLQHLAKLQALDDLSDKKMMRKLRSAKIDPDAPNPSVETLLHAFLPNKFILHTHSNAVLALTNQADGAKRSKKVFGTKVEVLPYTMPGFKLAKKAILAYEKTPDIFGLVMMKHGPFTFGETAKEAYDRMIRLVTLAELELRKKRKNVFNPKKLSAKLHSVSEIAPIIRGALGSGWLLDFRTNKLIKNFVAGKELSRYGTAGPVTPDHVIWTKAKPLVLPAPDLRQGFSKRVHQSVEKFGRQYFNYYNKHNKRHGEKKIIRDVKPRVIMLPGVGLFGVGSTIDEARIAADLACVNIEVITNAEAIGRYRPVSQADIFDIEYWSLEVAKLQDLKPAPLQGQVVLITGAGSGIGAATAKAFAEQGATLIVLDLNLKSIELVAQEIGGLALVCDVTKPKDVRRAFDAACKTFGGVDIVVSNAGAAWQGEIGTVDERIVRESFELNFFAHQSVAQNAVRVMRAQNLGGRLLFNTSKQAINPGVDFGPYGLPKAATLSLMRQYAVDHGKDGITSNAVNADRIRSGLLTDAMISNRSRARNTSEADYMSGNLLGEEVTAEDVAKAFVDLALSPKTTAAVITVDGGNIAAALR